MRFDKENTKALYRKCFALINLYEYEKAEETLNNLKKIMSDNSELKILENTLHEKKTKKTEDNLKEMKKYKNMMRYYHKINEEKEYQEM